MTLVRIQKDPSLREAGKFEPLTVNKLYYLQNVNFNLEISMEQPHCLDLVKTPIPIVPNLRISIPISECLAPKPYNL